MWGRHRLIEKSSKDKYFLKWKYANTGKLMCEYTKLKHCEIPALEKQDRTQIALKIIFFSRRLVMLDLSSVEISDVMTVVFCNYIVTTSVLRHLKIRTWSEEPLLAPLLNAIVLNQSIKEFHLSGLCFSSSALAERTLATDNLLCRYCQMHDVWLRFEIPTTDISSILVQKLPSYNVQCFSMNKSIDLVVFTEHIGVARVPCYDNLPIVNISNGFGLQETFYCEDGKYKRLGVNSYRVLPFDQSFTRAVDDDEVVRADSYDQKDLGLLLCLCMRFKNLKSLSIL